MTVPGSSSRVMSAPCQGPEAPTGSVHRPFSPSTLRGLLSAPQGQTALPAPGVFLAPRGLRAACWARPGQAGVFSAAALQPVWAPLP